MSSSVSADPANSQRQADAPQAPSTSTRNKRRRQIASGIGLVVLAGLVVWGGRYWTVGRFIESTDDAYMQADSVTVAPKVSGYVAEVLVRDNEAVSVGQPLVRLDIRQYKASLAEAQATIASRRADVARAEAELAQQTANIAQARAQVDGARADAKYAASQVERYAPLVKSGAETEERNAELRNAQTRAAATLASNEAALRSTQSQVPTLEARLQQARAQIAVSEASAQRTQLDVDDTVVRSTLAGRVADRSVRVGQFAQPGTRLMTIVPVQDLYLTANFKETQVGDMRAGQPVTIHVDALRGGDLHGTVESLSPGTGSQFALLPPQNATGNFTKIVQRVPVRIHVEVPASARDVLVPGLSVVVDVDTREGHGAPAKSASAVKPAAEAPRV